MNADWVGPVAVYMLGGLKTTIALCAITVVASTLVGIVLGTLSVIRWLPLELALRAYIEFWRGLPTIVSLFFIFFALPTVHVYVNAFAAAAVGLTLWASANIAEIVRGAIGSIPRDQFTAGAALGLGWLSVMQLIILPQALRRMIPPLVGMLVNLIQTTTLAAVIGVLDVLEAGKQSVERLTLQTGNPHALEVYAAILVIFFAMCFPLSQYANSLEKRLVV
ncbi:MAG TPA: amino acid ABC transporter permease [Candidatus Acidoferrales bacterium]|nr:amino acid ABC transporter permease [Candidatus Acidoferrales bacterium]